MTNTRRHRKRAARIAALSRRRVSAATRIRRKHRKTTRGGGLFTGYENNLLDVLIKTDPSFKIDFDTIVSEQKCQLDSTPVYNDPRGNTVVQRQRTHEYVQCLLASFDIFLERHKNKIITAVANDEGEINLEIKKDLIETDYKILQNMIHPPKPTMFGKFKRMVVGNNKS